MKRTLTALLLGAALLLLGGCTLALPGNAERPASADGPPREDHDVVLRFPSDRYPETAAHIREAIASGETAVCTINRGEADANRDASLEDMPARKGYDRDEWPMAMCDEGGAGADIRYIDPSDNRGAGAWVGNRLEDWPDGTRVLFVVE